MVEAVGGVIVLVVAGFMLWRMRRSRSEPSEGGRNFIDFS
jgi:hypothetical protein